MRFLLIFCGAAVLSASPLPCVSGSYSSLVAAGPCSIGNALFTFENFFASQSFNNAFGNPDADSLMFAIDSSDPMRPGFTITPARGGFGADPIDNIRMDVTTASQRILFHYMFAPLAGYRATGLDLDVNGLTAVTTSLIADFSHEYDLPGPYDPVPFVSFDAFYPGGNLHSTNPLAGAYQDGSNNVTATFGAATYDYLPGAFVSFDSVATHYDLAAAAPEPATWIVLLGACGLLLGLAVTRGGVRRR